MVKISLLVVTLVALFATGATSLFWSSGSSSSDSSEERTPFQCQWGRRRQTPGRPSATAMYVDGSGMLIGNQAKFYDGSSCILSFMLDNGRYFASTLWSAVGNSVTKYRCTRYSTSLYKSIWKNCSFADSSWPVEVNVDAIGTCSYNKSTDSALKQLSSSPLFCRAYIRCGPKGSNSTTTTASTTSSTSTTTRATTTTSKAGSSPPSTTPAPPPPPPASTTTTASRTDSTTPASSATATPTSNQGGVTGSPLSVTTTCPPLETSCKPNASCTILDASYTGKAGQSYTLVFTFEGNPPPNINAFVGSTNLNDYVLPLGWINTTLSTYKYQITIPAVDFTVVGTWNVTGKNNVGSQTPASIEPEFSLTIDPPAEMISFSLNPNPIPVTKNARTFRSGSQSIIGALFQVDSCNDVQVAIGNAATPDPDISLYLRLYFDQLAQKFYISPYSAITTNGGDYLPETPSACLSASQTTPVWMAFTLKTNDESAQFPYEADFFIQDYMTQPAIDVISGTPTFSLGFFDVELVYSLPSLYIYFGSKSGATFPQYWFYQ